MIRKYIIAAVMCMPCIAMAQHQWTLNECIEHAIAHNITIKRQEANVKAQEISLNSAKNTRLPGVSASAGQNFNFGRGLNIDNMYLHLPPLRDPHHGGSWNPDVPSGVTATPITKLQPDLQLEVRIPTSVPIRIPSAHPA